MLIWFIENLILPFLPKIADYLYGRIGKIFHIVDVIVIVQEKKATFDIRVSNASIQTICLTEISCRLFNPLQKGMFH